MGNACFDGEQYTEDIQTRQYRCPETLLHLPYSFPADIWSAACVIYELLTGAYLFQPEGETESGRDLDQLSRFEEIAGRIPKDYAEQSPRRREFFKSDVRMTRRSETLENIKITTRIETSYTLETTDKERN